MSPDDYAVRLREITKSFGRHRAVDALSLDVPRRSVYGFIGPNGSGKTTTLRMIMHILLPDSGEATVLGDPAQGAANDSVGYLPEERGLYKKMSVRRILKYFAALKGMAAPEASAEIDRWLSRMNLNPWAEKKVETLSKGMSQKLQFIAAVVSKPKLVILDEPFSGLDPVNLEVLREAILELRDNGTTVILSTHDMGLAEEMCDFICMIHKGKKVLDGTLAQIQNRYGADTVRVRLEEGAALLKEYPDLESVHDFGQLQEVRLKSEPQKLLRYLTERAAVRHFEVVHPSLHDIFIRIAGNDGEYPGEPDE
jgi:ABC-2 type transport system ATP-binding protein